MGVESQASQHIHPQEFRVTPQARKRLLNSPAQLIWFTGLSGSGKSTLANALETSLHASGYPTLLLDGDNIRSGLNRDLGFAPEDRKENLRRIGEVAKLLLDGGLTVLAAFIAPYREDREMVRQIVGAPNYREVFVDCPVEECEKRDVKGLYAKARAGVISGFTGIDAPYQAPEAPDIHLNTQTLSIQAALSHLHQHLQPQYPRLAAPQPTNGQPNN